MTLTIHAEENEQRELQMTVEVPEERVEQAMRRLARNLAKEMNVPGFRRGKAPYRVIVRRVGRDALRAEAIDDMVSHIFDEALEQSEFERSQLYAQPVLEDLEIEPLVLQFKLPLTPHVALGVYRDIRKEIEPVEVTEDAVQEALERVQARHQELEEVDRPAEEGDVVTVSGTGVLLLPVQAEIVTEADEADVETADAGESVPVAIEEEIIFDEASANLLLDRNKLFVGTPFVDNLLGVTAGDVVTFEFTLPEDFEDPDLAGHEARFELEVLSVKQRDLPPLDDELAQEDGQFETLAELRESIRDNLVKQAEDQARDDLIDEMVDELLADAELLYPPVAVENELDEMIENYKNRVQRSGWQWDDFLVMQGMTEANIRDNRRETAVDRLERQLVLRQFILDEKIQVKGEDVDAKIDERVAQFDNEELRDGMRDYFRQGQGFDVVSSEVLQDKVYERVKAIMTGAAPSLEELEAQAAAETAVDEEE